MKKVETYIRPEKLQRVKDALDKIGIKACPLSMSAGGVPKVASELAGRTGDYTVDFIDKSKLEMFVNCDVDIEGVITAIADAARSDPNGKAGDGKIFISPVDDAVRIRDLGRGEKVC